jgi:CheY-like chemotaxis protein
LDPETLHGVRILAIDGDPSVCAHLENTLIGLGMTATVCCTTAEGLASLESGQSFDVIMIDWDCPELVHHDFPQLIGQKIDADLPIIISSVYDRIELERENALTGINDFITKPLFRSTLYHKIHKILFTAPMTPIDPKSAVGKRLDGVRILMAEDNALNTEIALEILTLAGIQLDCATNGLDAVDIFNNAPPSTYSLILMDMQMPVMGGCDATRAIRRLEREDATTIPIIAMTANAFDEDIREAFDAGMNEHVAKPVDFEILFRVINKYLTC